MTKQANKGARATKEKTGNPGQGNAVGQPLVMQTGWEGMFADWLVNQEYGVNGIGGNVPLTHASNNPLNLMLGGASNAGLNPNMFNQLTPQQQELLTKNLADQQRLNSTQIQGNDLQMNLLQNLQEGNGNIGNKSNQNRKKTSASQRTNEVNKLPSSSNTNMNNRNVSNIITGVGGMPNSDLSSQFAAMQNNLAVPNGLMSALSDNMNVNMGVAPNTTASNLNPMGIGGLPTFGGTNNFSYDLFNKTGIDLSKNLDFDDYDEDDDIDMDDDDSDEDLDGTRQKKRAKTSSKQMTEEQKLERRERNREHAKRSRVRKKFLLESLQKSVNALQDENDKLKNSIKEHLGDEQAEVVLSSLDTGSKDSLVTADPKSATKILDDPDYTLVKALQTAQQNFVITDPALHDHPIVYASHGFMALTGYKLEQILGRNCRFLQGPETDPEAVAQVREAIQNGTDCSVCLLNYRADGSTFWNQFFIAALRDSDGAVVNYVGVQCKIREDVAKEIVAAEREKRKELKMAREKCSV